MVTSKALKKTWFPPSLSLQPKTLQHRSTKYFLYSTSLFILLPAKKNSANTLTLNYCQTCMTFTSVLEEKETVRSDADPNEDNSFHYGS